eukprot:COSAG01_NODE_5171_length_4436_cov_4.031128_7_plen_94_part_00
MRNGAQDPEHVKIIATCKHFVANSLENWHGHTRHNFNANVSKADLVGYYLPAFKACIMEGKALGIMCSYNAVCPLLCLHPGATDMAVAVAMYR